MHVTQRVMTLEKIARLTEGGVDNLAVRYFPCILSNFFFQYLEKGVTNHKTEVIARFVHTDDNIDGVTKNITRLVIGDHHELSDKVCISSEIDISHKSPMFSFSRRLPSPHDPI